MAKLKKKEEGEGEGEGKDEDEEEEEGEETRDLGRNDWFQVCGRIYTRCAWNVITYQIARKPSKTTGVMSKRLRSRLEEAAIGRWEIFSFNKNCNRSEFLKYVYFFNKFIYLFIFGCIGSSLLCLGLLFSCGKWGLLFVVVLGLLIAVASLVEEHGL